MDLAGRLQEVRLCNEIRDRPFREVERVKCHGGDVPLDECLA